MRDFNGRYVRHPILKSILEYWSRSIPNDQIITRGYRSKKYNGFNFCARCMDNLINRICLMDPINPVYQISLCNIVSTNFK